MSKALNILCLWRKNEKGLTSFLRVTFSQYSKAFGLPATPVVLQVPGVNTPSYWVGSMKRFVVPTLLGT